VKSFVVHGDLSDIEANPDLKAAMRDQMKLFEYVYSSCAFSSTVAFYWDDRMIGKCLTV